MVVPAHLWLMLYVDAAALQVGLYIYNRRHNVSPHEKSGSAGVAGMLISALSAPVYAASLAAVMLRRSRGFVTTPKGDASTRDTVITFRKHLLWALVFGVPLALSFVARAPSLLDARVVGASLVVCLLPVAIWRVELMRARRAKPAVVPKAVPVPAAAPAVEPRLEPVAAEKREPNRRERQLPVRRERRDPGRREHLRPVPDQPREPVRRERLAPAAKNHEVVRFERRTPEPVHHRVPERVGPVEPVRELRPGRRKHHVVVRFESTQRGTSDGGQPRSAGPGAESDLAWQVFDQIEA